MAEEEEKKSVGIPEAGAALAAAGVTFYGTGRAVQNRVATRIGNEYEAAAKEAMGEFTKANPAPVAPDISALQTKWTEDFHTHVGKQAGGTQILHDLKNGTVQQKADAIKTLNTLKTEYVKTTPAIDPAKVMASHSAAQEAWGKQMSAAVDNHAGASAAMAKAEKIGAAGFVKKPFAIFANQTRMGKVGTAAAVTAVAAAAIYGVHKWRNRVKSDNDKNGQSR